MMRARTMSQTLAAIETCKDRCASISNVDDAKMLLPRNQSAIMAIAVTQCRSIEIQP